MKIAYLTYWSINEGLSQSTSLKNLKILNEMYNIDKIHYYTFEKDILQKDIDLPNKVIHFPLERKKGSKILNKIYDFFHAWRTIKKNQNTIKYDLVIARSSFSGIFAFFLYLIYKIPFVVESFEPHSKYQINIPNGWSKFGMRYFILNFFERIQKKFSSILLPVSNSYKQILIKEGVSKNKIIVQPCCADYSFQQFNNNDKNKIRKDLNISIENIVGIYVGKFGGIYYEKEAFDMISKINNYLNHKFSIIILTPDDKSYIIRQLIDRGVKIQNINILYVNQQEVVYYLLASDFAFNFHITNKFSNCFSPIKNAEYWATGLPLIIPKNIGDDSNIVENLNIGIVHDFSKNLDSLQIEKLIEIILSVNIRKKIFDMTLEFRSNKLIKRSYEQMFIYLFER